MADPTGFWKMADAADEKLDKADQKAPTPKYRYAQKAAMEKGDAGTYFMRKTGKQTTSKKKGKTAPGKRGIKR